MKQIIISIWIALLTLPVFAQQQMQAKVVLDKTAATFEKAGGIRAGFNVTVFNKGRMAGQSAGVIELRGEKFVLKTDVVPRGLMARPNGVIWQVVTRSISAIQPESNCKVLIRTHFCRFIAMVSAISLEH